MSLDLVVSEKKLQTIQINSRSSGVKTIFYNKVEKNLESKTVILWKRNIQLHKYTELELKSMRWAVDVEAEVCAIGLMIS